VKGNEFAAHNKLSSYALFFIRYRGGGGAGGWGVGRAKSAKHWVVVCGVLFESFKGFLESETLYEIKWENVHNLWRGCAATMMLESSGRTGDARQLLTTPSCTTGAKAPLSTSCFLTGT
jgi:hypothetical protein